eukprot:jgi/Ulvmu1/3866/UM018_0085.1
MNSDQEQDLQQSHAKPLQKGQLVKFKAKVDKSGIVYMSRVPPHLKPLKLRQMLETYAKLGRIYMAPKEIAPKKVRGQGSSSGAQKQGKQFSEAWIEFVDKKQAKAVVEMINCTPMGGKNRSRYKEDLWNLKYLPKFKWDHLTEEIAYQKAVREKLFAQELSKAKRERDFYLSKVAQAKKNDAIMSRKRERGIEVKQDGAEDTERRFKQRKGKKADGEEQPQIADDVLQLFA